MFDIRKHFGAFAMDVISSCGYGIDIDSVNNPDHPIMVNAKKVLSTDANFSMILSIIWPKLARFFKLNFFDINAINFFDKLFNDIVKRRMNSNEDMNEQGNF